MYVLLDMATTKLHAPDKVPHDNSKSGPAKSPTHAPGDKIAPTPAPAPHAPANAPHGNPKVPPPGATNPQVPKV